MIKPLTQAEIDVLPRGVTIYSPFEDHSSGKVRTTYSNGGRSAEVYDYFLTEEDAKEQAKLNHILWKLKGK